MGALHYCEGDLKWQSKGIDELLAFTDKVSFRDWHPDLMDNVTDMVVAVSLGYDWFRPGLNNEQAATIRTCLAEKGIGALIAHLEGEEIPESAKGVSGGQTGTSKKGTPPKAPVKGQQAKPDVGKLPPDSKQMAAASALLLSAICLVDDDPAIAKRAADAAAKVFGKGIVRFAPAGVWPEGLQAGEEVMDYVAMVASSLKAAAGKDLGISLLEGIPQFNTARMHLMGPTGQGFNFGDAKSAVSVRPWVATWLCGVAGNPGIRAVVAGGKLPVTSSYFGQVGNFIHTALLIAQRLVVSCERPGFIAIGRIRLPIVFHRAAAVVTGENHDRIAALPVLLQRRQDQPYCRVQVHDARRILPRHRARHTRRHLAHPLLRLLHRQMHRRHRHVEEKRRTLPCSQPLAGLLGDEVRHMPLLLDELLIPLPRHHERPLLVVMVPRPHPAR
jgi:hypothetical protein